MHIAIRSLISAAPGDPSPRPARRRILPALGLAALLGACSSPDIGFNPYAWNPLALERSQVALDSLTVQRVRGGNPEFAPLLAEPGNVWPAQEAPRPTLLGGPEEAMRNIPEYRPQLIQGAPPARSPISGPPERGLPGSSAVPAPIPLPEQPRVSAQPPALPATPPSVENRLLVDPQGRPAVGTGQAGRVQGYTQPGVGGGAVIRDGNVETWIGPDGRAHTRVVPPGQR